jgi:hypothetical protein
MNDAAAIFHNKKKDPVCPSVEKPAGDLACSAEETCRQRPTLPGRIHYTRTGRKGSNSLLRVEVKLPGHRPGLLEES